ncbi:MAG: hypothetical protein LLG37_06240 [Spirochaetia bacterium]|nr:hypothetical protein [Spirochaetia bacterium]
MRDMILTHKRIWFVTDNEKGIKQVWLPHGNVWYSDEIKGSAVDPATLGWVQRNYDIAEKRQYYGNNVYLLVRRY